MDRIEETEIRVFYEHSAVFDEGAIDFQIVIDKNGLKVFAQSHTYGVGYNLHDAERISIDQLITDLRKVTGKNIVIQDEDHGPS